MQKLHEILTILSLPGMDKATFWQKYSEVPNTSGLDELTEFVLQIDRRNYPMKESNQAWYTADRFLQRLPFYPDVTVFTYVDPEYPQSLRALGNAAPPLLYVRGNPSVLSLPTLGIVGTRQPSQPTLEYGAKIVQRIKQHTDRVIVSGLARGCDRIAHEAAIDAGLKAIAVLPSGVLKITPYSNNDLANKILETGGCLVSEYGLGDEAKQHTYVERDGIIAAISEALLVLEGGVRSGTMHTVDFAEHMGKPLACFLPENAPASHFEGNRYMIQTKGAFGFKNHTGLTQFLEKLDQPAQ